MVSKPKLRTPNYFLLCQEYFSSDGRAILVMEKAYAAFPGCLATLDPGIYRVSCTYKNVYISLSVSYSRSNTYLLREWCSRIRSGVFDVFSDRWRRARKPLCFRRQKSSGSGCVRSCLFQREGLRGLTPGSHADRRLVFLMWDCSPGSTTRCADMAENCRVFRPATG